MRQASTVLRRTFDKIGTPVELIREFGSRAGFEQAVYQFANAQPVLYGIATVALGGLIGVLSSALVGMRRR